MLKSSELEAEAAPTPDLSVPEVRRCLALLRKQWHAAQLDPRARPAYLTDNLGHEGKLVPAADFALAFVMSHHAKRGASDK